MTGVAGRLIGAMATIVDGTSFASISVMPDVASRELHVMSSVRINSPVADVDLTVAGRLARHVREDPGYRCMQDRALRGEVLSDVDVMSKRRVTGSGPFRECYGPRDAGFHAAFTVGDAGRRYLAAVFRRDAPLGGREVGMLEALRDHFAGLPSFRWRLELPEEPSSGHLAAMRSLGLSGAEAEVMWWVSEGKRSGEIAVILGKSERTVHAQLRSIFRTLGVETRVAAARVVADALQATRRT